MSSAAVPEGSSTNSRLAVAVLCAAGIVVALMQTIIVPLIPELPTLLNTTPTNAAWALTITLLTGAVVTPISGRLGDMVGKRRMLLACLAAVAVGSLVCALSSSLIPFLIGRGLQGMGIGTVALGISLIRDIVPIHRLGSSIGAMSASLGVGGSLGLPFAAAIAQHLSWHALFWVSAGFAVAAMAAVLATVPASATATGGRFDAIGALGLSVFLVCILLALSKGHAWGWTSPTVLGLFAGFVVVAVLWWQYERRHPNALIDLQINVRRPVLLTNIASMAAGFVFYAMQMMPIQVLMAPESAPAGTGLSMVQAALVLMPGGLVMFAFSYVSAWMSRQFGARISLGLGSLIIGLGYAIFLVMLVGPWATSWIWLIWINAVVGAGLGIAYAAMPSLIMEWVPVTQTGEANGVNSTMRSIGTSLATAVVAMILSASIAMVDGPSGPLPFPTVDAYVWATIISLVVSVLAAGAAFSVPRSELVDDPVDCN
ncbi:MFS transporter [Gordonia sp. (in: high G+C Gram-positive bacteria)]|uniref:MFS transporter n=1 Tax=Gordonia sp. (in: high G+C Gram-positive bacteria) TaxID=84139 RepID=UPI0016AD41E5|nr:MFS transporter [Gordonia sp. (in: high G+C Gram-positive bacteria)]NLG45623.1 MFS transporter [Gordonia sp. (in: high G+C Gram-positive bacteria)]